MTAKTMPCFLSVSGANLDLDSLLKAFPVDPLCMWRKGEALHSSGNPSKVSPDSEARFDVSAADFDNFIQQHEDAIEFLVAHKQDLLQLTQFPGVECVKLDFGIALKETFVHSDVLSPAFLRAAADAGVTVKLSHYPPTG